MKAVITRISSVSSAAFSFRVNKYVNFAALKAKAAKYAFNMKLSSAYLLS